MTYDYDPKGAYSRTLVFKGENYTYWKANMYIHFLLVDKNLWCVVTEGPFIPKDDDDFVKHPQDWSDDETKKVSYDLKARNILMSTLSAKVFDLISHYMSAKGILDALRTLYEGKNDVNDSKINMFTEEFELFRMEPEESMDSMQTRFLHLINKLSNLGKTFYNKDFTNKILRSMCREWKPKVTSIKESNDLSILDII